MRERGAAYRRYEELHVQRAYSLAEIRTLITEAGMEYLGAWEAYTDTPPTDASKRLLFAARERGK